MPIGPNKRLEAQANAIAKSLGIEIEGRAAPHLALVPILYRMLEEIKELTERVGELERMQ